MDVMLWYSYLHIPIGYMYISKMYYLYYTQIFQYINTYKYIKWVYLQKQKKKGKLIVSYIRI